MQFKRSLSICTKWVRKFKVHFWLKCYCSKFIFTWAFICLQPAFCFKMGKKLWRHTSFSSTYFSYYRKHPNSDKKIFPLPSSSCFQQHFHDWFYVLRCNSDLSKLEWTILLFNFNYIRDLTNRRKLFSIPVAEYASFSHQARVFKTNLLSLISNFSKYYFKTGTICPFSYIHMYLPL